MGVGACARYSSCVPAVCLVQFVDRMLSAVQRVGRGNRWACAGPAYGYSALRCANMRQKGYFGRPCVSRNREFGGSDAEYSRISIEFLMHWFDSTRAHVSGSCDVTAPRNNIFSDSEFRGRFITSQRGVRACVSDLGNFISHAHPRTTR